MRIIEIDGKSYRIVRENEFDSGTASDDVLVARPCVECGDQLLGTPESLQTAPQPRCEDGHHNSRPGVWY